MRCNKFEVSELDLCAISKAIEPYRKFANQIDTSRALIVAKIDLKSSSEGLIHRHSRMNVVQQGGNVQASPPCVPLLNRNLSSGDGMAWRNNNNNGKEKKGEKPLVEKHRNQIFESLSVVTVNAKKVSRSYVWSAARITVPEVSKAAWPEQNLSFGRSNQITLHAWFCWGIFPPRLSRAEWTPPPPRIYFYVRPEQRQQPWLLTLTSAEPWGPRVSPGIHDLPKFTRGQEWIW
jgi:hypothetical protein